MIRYLEIRSLGKHGLGFVSLGIVIFGEREQAM
jgi:hypothetical protein